MDASCVTVKIGGFSVDILVNASGDLMLCVDEPKEPANGERRCVDILVDADLNVIADGRKAA